MYFGKVELDINPINVAETGTLAQYLQEIVDQGDGTQEDIAKAKELIDNLPQEPEEKKEPAPQREMRIAEVKKVRKRVSMKKLLPQKMAEAAEREKKASRGKRFK